MGHGIQSAGLIVLETATDHPALVWLICIATTVLFIIFLVATPQGWKVPPLTKARTICIDRAERSCDAVLSVCALLIPATLGLLTWLHEKVAFGSYIVPLGFALTYFFVLLIFSAHLRFNFLWRYERDFDVVPNQSMRFAYWLTAATSCIVLGLFLVSIPVLQLGFGWLNVKDAPAATPPSPTVVKVDCDCKPSPPAQPVKAQGEKQRGTKRR